MSLVKQLVDDGLLKYVWLILHRQWKESYVTRRLQIQLVYIP